MESKLETAQEAAIGFARRMRPGDLMEVIDFDGQVTILQAFTSDVAALERAIRQATVNGSTSLYNAIYISLKDLKKARTAPRHRDPARGDRRAVRRRRHLEPGRLRRSARPREAIGNGDLRDRPEAERRRPRDFKEAEFVLRQLSQETGGRAFYPGTRRRAAEDLRADRPGAEQPVLDRLRLEERGPQRRLAAIVGPGARGRG